MVKLYKLFEAILKEADIKKPIVQKPQPQSLQQVQKPALNKEPQNNVEAIQIFEGSKYPVMLKINIQGNSRLLQTCWVKGQAGIQAFVLKFLDKNNDIQSIISLDDKNYKSFEFKPVNNSKKYFFTTIEFYNKIKPSIQPSKSNEDLEDKFFEKQIKQWEEKNGALHDFLESMYNEIINTQGSGSYDFRAKG